MALHTGLQRALLANIDTRRQQGVREGTGDCGRRVIGGAFPAGSVTFHLVIPSGLSSKLPQGIDGKIEKTRITLNGIDGNCWVRTAANIRGFRKPEPYKGKGIKYVEEFIRRKAGMSRYEVIRPDCPEK